MSAVLEKLMNIKHGETVVYHTGRLIEDRRWKSETHEILRVTQRLLKQDRVFLFQRRVDGATNVFEYLAIGRSQRRENTRPDPRRDKGAPPPRVAVPG